MKVREVIPHIGPIPNVIPLKLFLDLQRDQVFTRGLSDSQSYVPIFTNVAWEFAQLSTFVKMGTYNWLSDNPRGNTGSCRRSKNNLRGITMRIGPI